jgi:hypothetical protein
MKRIIAFSILALCAVTLVSAHGNNRRGRGFPGGPQHSREWKSGNHREAPAPEETNISGNLTIAKGMVALVDKDTTYLLMGLNRYTGFIDGLKEGATVSLKGHARTDPRDKNVKFMRVEKLSLNNKEYDLALPYQGGKQNRQYNHSPRQNRGRR